MSIWTTTSETAIPAKDKYGTHGPAIPEGSVDVSITSKGPIMRLDVDDGYEATSLYLSPDEARVIAAALTRAADTYTS